jgi:hypothetical protein
MRLFTWLALVAVAALGCNKERGGSGPAASGPGPEAAPGKSWKEYSSTGYEFKTRFPGGNPTERGGAYNKPRSVEDFIRPQMEKYDGNRYLAQFAILAVRFRPNTSPADRETAVAELQKDFQLPAGVTPSGSKPVTWGGRPATETVYESGPEGQRERLVVRQLVLDDYGYVGLVRQGGDVTPRDEETFWQGFQLTPGTGPRSAGKGGKK